MTPDACGDMILLVQAELDGELDAAGAAALAAHVQGCAGCAGLQSDLAGLSGQLRGGLTRFAAPRHLRQAVAAPVPRRRVPWLHGASFGAGMALAAGIAAIIVLPERSGPRADIVAAHIRALQPGHLVDVASTDQHTVKPWFDGRVDFAPPVRDFAAQGFPLVGGRLDYLAGRAVAALVYRHDRHLIDVFVWPGSGAASEGQVQGYNVEAWSQAGMNFRAVTDLNAAELGDLAKLLRTPG